MTSSLKVKFLGKRHDFLNQSLPVRTALLQNRKPCRPTPAGFSMCASAAARHCGRSGAIVACSVPMARYRVRLFKQSIRARPARLPAVRGVIPHGKRSPKFTRLAAQPADQPVGVVDFSGRDACWSVHPGAGSDHHLDHRAHLEGAPWASSVLCWPCPSTLIPYAAVCGGQRSTLRAACAKASTQIWLLQKVIKLPKPACTNNDPRSSRGVLSCPRAAILLAPRAGEMEHLPSTCLILHVIRR
jgi:hypothetical protein